MPRVNGYTLAPNWLLCECVNAVVSVGEHVDEILGAAVADGKVTPKVQSLIKILLGYQHTDDFRAIIFVERVVAAQILPKVPAQPFS
jgi:endoribonuclease Dicer